MLVDAMTMRMTLKPQTLDTIVATNLHADILSDLAAALAGSLGIAPTANLNPERVTPSMFEPIHGSAFDITGKGIANPVATFWTGAMMLEHLDEKGAAAKLMRAVEMVTADKAYHTPDLARQPRRRSPTPCARRSRAEPWRNSSGNARNGGGARAAAKDVRCGDRGRATRALHTTASSRPSRGAHARHRRWQGRGESVKPGDPRLARAETRMVATPQISLEAAAEVARKAGITAAIFGDSIEGESSDVGKVMAGIALQVARRGQPFKAPCVLLSGGETTVTVRGNGRGGRSVEFLLSLGIALDGQPGIYALAGDTDGVDGQEEIAGAYLAPDTLARAWAKGIRPKDSLANNDGHSFFEALGDSVVTGPTLTNVNDFRAILIK